jgi:hypothetical protein
MKRKPLWLASVALALIMAAPAQLFAADMEFDAEGNPTSIPEEYIDALKTAYKQHSDGQILQKALFTLISNCKLDGETMAGFATTPEMATQFLFVREFFPGGRFYGRTHNGVDAAESRARACIWLACNTGAGECPSEHQITSPSDVTPTTAAEIQPETPAQTSQPSTPPEKMSNVAPIATQQMGAATPAVTNSNGGVGQGGRLIFGGAAPQTTAEQQ